MDKQKTPASNSTQKIDIDLEQAISGELQSWVDNLIWMRIFAIVASDRQFIELESKKLELVKVEQQALEQRQKSKEKHFRRIASFFTSSLVVVVCCGFSFMIGLLGGVNLPEAVLCEESNILCYYTRLRK